MYLTANRSVNKEQKQTVQQLFPELNSKSPVSAVVIETAYWRKANAIHSWFVRECQGDVDNCGKYYVSREKLEKLKSTCESVLLDHTKAAELLTTARGFFFGDTDYNEDYFDTLTYTVKAIEEALQLSLEWEFEYSSSW